MDPQVGPAAATLSEDQKREQRAKLIKALSRFKPRDANPQQFYNCVREICIMHNCKVDEGLERAALTWPGLTKRQREIYDSVRGKFGGFRGSFKIKTIFFRCRSGMLSCLFQCRAASTAPWVVARTTNRLQKG